MKPYILSHLNNGEELLYQCRKHWLSLLPAFLLTLAALVLLMNASNIASLVPEYPAAMKAVKYFAAVFALALLYRAAKDYIVFFSTELAFTDRRLIGKVGFFRVRTLLTPLDKINHISATNGFLGRFLNFGNVLVHTSSGQITYEQIVGHLDFINALMDRIAVWHQEGGAAAQGNGRRPTSPHAPFREQAGAQAQYHREAALGPPRLARAETADERPVPRMAPPAETSPRAPMGAASKEPGAPSRFPDPPGTAGAPFAPDQTRIPAGKLLQSACPFCQTTYSYQPSHAGMNSKCRKCGNTITFPLQGGQAQG
ncbi:MAG: PH domain-containing protein [Deltaproteobacteria bacterium]|jgi:membrane protein YdbS with pleckstrin-like domain/ribosomal protein S27E|nr:PH domain-containing protein [Deltaproteobacteria bacterium]